VSTVKETEIQDLKRRFESAGQGHVFLHFETLDEAGRNRLLAQLKTIDLLQLEVFKALIEHPVEKESSEAQLEPAEAIHLPRTPDAQTRADAAFAHGESLIRAGRVGAFVVAGGQGSRLGFDGPKGSFPVGPVTDRSLFQIFAEKILAASRRYNVTIPWYIMTSQANDADTRAFFASHNYFGMSRADVIFFAQRMVPALDVSGKLMLDAPDHVFMSPNGHGGSLLALKEGGALEDMERRGIDMLSYFQVDNVLINPVDPLFIGHHNLAGAEMSSKMLIKRDPWEKVGVFGRIGGKLVVVEYSDLSEAEATARAEDGSLRFGAGSIAIHLIQRQFVEQLTAEGLRLPYHVAYKKIPVMDHSGALQSPELPNGYKFETFVFDALTETTSSVILEIAREEEFSPVKNAAGEDSAATAQADLMAQYSRWFEALSIDLPRREDGSVALQMEISPLFADGPASLKARLPGDFTPSDPLILKD